MLKKYQVTSKWEFFKCLNSNIEGQVWEEIKGEWRSCQKVQVNHQFIVKVTPVTKNIKEPSLKQVLTCLEKQEQTDVKVRLS